MQVRFLDMLQKSTEITQECGVNNSGLDRRHFSSSQKRHTRILEKSTPSQLLSQVLQSRNKCGHGISENLEWRVSTTSKIGSMRVRLDVGGLRVNFPSVKAEI